MSRANWNIVTPDESSGSRDLNYILIFVGSISFLYLVGILFSFNLSAYMNPHLRQLNPQSVAGVWMYGIELILGLVLLAMSLLGMTIRSFDSLGIRRVLLVLPIISIACFAYFLKLYIFGLFFVEYFIGIGLVLMVLGALRNILLARKDPPYAE